MSARAGAAEIPSAARRRVIRQALIVVGTSLGSLLALAFLSFVLAREYDEVVRELSDESALRITLGDTLQLLVDGETAQRGYVLTANPAFLESFEERRHELPGTLERLRAQLRTKGLDAEHEQLAAAVRARSALTEEVVARVAQGDVDGARAVIASGEGRRRMGVVRELVDGLVTREEARVAALIARSEAARQRLFPVFVALVLLSLAIGGYGVVSARRELRTLEGAERAARESERWFRMIAEGASDLVRVHDREGRIAYASPSVERLLGYAPRELLARDAMDFVHEEDRGALRDALAAPERASPLLHRMVRKDGALRWFETRIQPVHDEAGAIERLHTISRDVTERIEADAVRSREAEQLVERMNRDDLTGLYNRRGFHQHAESLLARARAEDRPVLFVFCDVNGLKTINDRLGHDAGDDVIRDAAQIVRQSARETDVVARLGGDELVMAGIVRDEDAAALFERRVHELSRAHDARAQRPYRVSLSVGAVLWRAESGKTIDEMLQLADAAMYTKKRERRTAVTASGRGIVRDPDRK